jgi:hypothetical protein
MLKVQHSEKGQLMLDLLATLAAAAPHGTPVDWRAATWPEHDTVSMRALIENDFVAVCSIRTVRVTPAGVARLRARRKARWRERQAHARARAAALAILHD